MDSFGRFVVLEGFHPFRRDLRAVLLGQQHFGAATMRAEHFWLVDCPEQAADDGPVVVNLTISV